MVRLAAWLGLKNPSFNAVQDWVLALREELKIPAKLDGLGVDGARTDEIAAMAADDPTAPNNPVPAGVPGTRRIFEADRTSDGEGKSVTVRDEQGGGCDTKK